MTQPTPSMRYHMTRGTTKASARRGAGRLRQDLDSPNPINNGSLGTGEAQGGSLINKNGGTPSALGTKATTAGGFFDMLTGGGGPIMFNSTPVYDLGGWWNPTADIIPAVSGLYQVDVTGFVDLFGSNYNVDFLFQILINGAQAPGTKNYEFSTGVTLNGTQLFPVSLSDQIEVTAGQAVSIEASASTSAGLTNAGFRGSFALALLGTVP